MFSKTTTTSLLLFSFLLVSGQKFYDSTLEESSFSVAGKTLNGYSSYFDFSKEEVTKGWWRYARKFGNPLDMRTHYEVTIPSENTDGNTDLLIFSETVVEEGKIIFRLGLEQKKYADQAGNLLLDFKKDLYINFYLEEMKLKEIEAEELSKSYETAIENEEKYQLLEQLKYVESEVEKLKEEIRKVDE